MLKQTATIFILSAFVVSALADPPPLLAAPTPAPSKIIAKKKKKVKKAVATSGQPATQLPAFKGVKHVTMDFDADASGSHMTTVVVRTPLPLDEAYEENAVAEKNLKSAALPDFQVTQKKKVIAPAPTPEPTLASNSSAVVLISKPAPTPVPVFLIPAPQPPPPAESPSVFTIDTRLAEAHAGPLEVTEPIAQEKSHAPQKSNEWDSSVTASRVFIGTSYLNAKYSQLESDLQDGATALSLGVARDWGPLEIGANLDIGHGLDQAVTIQNTRYVILQGDASYFFLPGWFSPFAGAGVGVGSFNVFSYRSTSSPNTTAIREHVDTTALALTPMGGVRFDVAAQFSIDLKLQYLLVVGGDNSSALGGLVAGGSLGYKF